MASHLAQWVKNMPAMPETQEMQVLSLGGEDLLEKGMATHSNSLVWRTHGQRSAAGYSLQGCKELDTTEVTEYEASTYMSEVSIHFWQHDELETLINSIIGNK